MKNREIMEFVPQEGWEKWRRKQKIKSCIVFWLSYIVFFVMLVIMIRTIF